MELKELIKAARLPRSQKQFAEDLGVSRLSVILWEKGTHKPNDKQLTAMGIQPRYVLELTE